MKPPLLAVLLALTACTVPCAPSPDALVPAPPERMPAAESAQPLPSSGLEATLADPSLVANLKLPTTAQQRNLGSP